MNPCPCGFYGDPKKECRCSHSMVSKYQRRISGPLMDRMDMFVEVPAVEYEKLMDDSQGETSDRVQSRVEEAREVQNRAFRWDEHQHELRDGAGGGMGLLPGGTGLSEAASSVDEAS